MSLMATIYEEPKEAKPHFSARYDRDDGPGLETAAPLFLGQPVDTPEALRLLVETVQDTLASLARRSSGDRGNVPPKDGAPWRPFDASESPPSSPFEEARP